MNERSYRLVKLAHWLDGKLALDAARTAELKKRALGLAQGLKAQSQPPIRVIGFDFFGSVFKGTAIEPCEDVDVLLALDPVVLMTQAGTQRTPRWTVSALRKEVESLRSLLVEQGHVQANSQRHSVGVNYPKSHMKVDMVPCLMGSSPGEVRIPRRFDEEWIVATPALDLVALRTLAQRHAALLPAVRLLKSWKRQYQVPLSSFAIELALREMVEQRAFADPVALVVAFWELCANHDPRRRLHLGRLTVPEPVTLIHPKTGENVLAGKTPEDRAELCDMSFQALEQLGEVRQRCFWRKASWAAQGLLELFVGDKVLGHLDEIRLGNWYYDEEW